MIARLRARLAVHPFWHAYIVGCVMAMTSAIASIVTGHVLVDPVMVGFVGAACYLIGWKAHEEAGRG